MKVTSNTTTTMDTNLSTVLLTIERDTDGSWIVFDRECDVWGRGRSLLEAMCDYWAALWSHFSVLDEQPLTQRLATQLTAIRKRLEQNTESRGDG